MTILQGFLSLIATSLTCASGLLAADIDATKVGVVGDGATLNTTAIQKAIDDCSAVGGGTIRFPAGRYLTGTIQIKSNVILRLDDQATLLGSTDVADYRNLDPFIDGSGNPLGHALIVAVDASNVGVEGKGTVDGQSPALKKKQKAYTMRPFLLRWVRCTNVTVKDVQLTNPGAWTLNFFQTRGAVVEGVTIRSRDLGMHNNDGINIDSSENLRVRNCDVNSGDDALVIKATSATQSSRAIVVSDCRLSTRTNAIKLGTESIGSFENISVSNCQITNTRMAGIALYAVDGGDLRNVTISDVTMDGVTMPISIRLGARLKAFREGDQPKPTAGKLRDVTIKNVSAKNIGMIGMLINGVPGFPVEALTLENIALELPGGGSAEAAKIKLSEKEKAYPEHDMFGKTLPAYGIYARHVRGIKIQNVRTSLLIPDARPATVFVDVDDVTPANFATELFNPKSNQGLKFEFGLASATPGYIQIAAQTTYDANRGFGFLQSAAATAAKPSIFAVDVGEGNYDVTFRFGNPSRTTSSTIKAESRRLMIENVETAPGKFETRTFTVNVRKPAISGGGTTSLNDREKGPPQVPDWDDHLTFEINGKNPGVASIEIKPAKDAITVFLAGDSTVTDQRNEPYAGWGQMLPRFFQQGVAVSNQAESGLALYSFERQKRLEKILSMMKTGDYLFIQFGHNDQKDKSPGAGPFTSYKTNLKRFVDAARNKGGIPVLVTSMERRHWNGSELKPSLAEYAEAARQVGAEEKVPVIDLNAMSLKLYTALGPDKSTKAFIHYPAQTFPGQDKPLNDDTHHNTYGGYELARCVVEGIKAAVPALATYLVKDAGAFDPTHPDPPEKVDIPASLITGATEKPAGN